MNLKLEILKKKNCLLKKMKTMQVGFLRSCFVVVFWEARSCQPPQQVSQVCTLPPQTGLAFTKCFFHPSLKCNRLAVCGLWTVLPVHTASILNLSVFYFDDSGHYPCYNPKLAPLAHAGFGSVCLFFFFSSSVILVSRLLVYTVFSASVSFSEAYVHISRQINCNKKNAVSSLYF